MASPDIPASQASFKYFYTDPLAAAWMAKHFGMRFCDRSGLSVSADPAMWYMADRHYQAGKLLIHPESLHLLQPQFGDIACVDEAPYTFTERGWASDTSDSYGDLLPEYIHMARIIQRNGVSFMWPERGDV